MMNSRALATRVLQDVIVNGQSLTRALLTVTHKLDDPKDQSLVKEMAFGTLRWYFRLDAIAACLISKPLKNKDQDIRFLILTGLYQLQYLSIPAHAVLSETVDAVKDFKKDWAKGLVNAVLRNFQRKKIQLVDQIEVDDVARYAHPRWLLKEIKSAWPQSWRDIVNANNQRPPLSLRVNRLKYDRVAYLHALSACDLDARALTHSRDGIRLLAPLPVDSIPEFWDGAVSVQDEAAQLAADLLQVNEGDWVLDACAAPGGKTCHILECMPTLGKLIALDIDKARLTQITENLDRLQLTDLQLVVLIEGDASDVKKNWWDGRLFDRILLDAPCSATGVIRRHPDIKIRRKALDIDNLVDLQATMLATLWSLLKPGGTLLYATCSILPQENHQQIQSFLQKNIDAKEELINASWGCQQPVGRQILPGENDNMDGFYFARIRKEDHVPK